LLYIAIDQSEFYSEKRNEKVDPMSGIQILKEETTNIWINVQCKKRKLYIIIFRFSLFSSDNIALRSKHN
jgi:hypothetical protein